MGETRDTKKILVVDDEPRILRFTKLSLMGAGFAVVTARDGEEALESIKNEKPDLMVLDMILGGIDGLDVLEALRISGGGYSEIPVIVFSARSTGVRVERAKTMADFIVKPFDPAVLAERIHEVLGRGQE